MDENPPKIRGDAFYEAMGAKRHYFYWIDLKGALFLEQTDPKTIATSLKSTSFLNFFFKNIQKNPLYDAKESEYGSSCEEEAVCSTYPFLSMCGNEMNFLQAADTPFVFHSYTPSDNNRESGDAPFLSLTFGGDLTVPFQPSLVRLCPLTNRFYHDILTGHSEHGHGGHSPSWDRVLRKRLHLSPQDSLSALVRIDIAMKLAEFVDMDEGTLAMDGRSHPLKPPFRLY